MKKHLPILFTLMLLYSFSFVMAGGPPGRGHHSSNMHGHNLPVMAMDAQSFHMAKNSIANKSFDSSKLTVARQVARSNYLTTFQIMEIMDLLDFESSKLDFAKDAYPAAVDPHNYYQVGDAFTFSSSVRELDQFLALQRPVQREVTYTYGDHDRYGYNAGASRGGRGNGRNNGQGMGRNVRPGNGQGQVVIHQSGPTHGHNVGNNVGHCATPVPGVSDAEFFGMRRAVENQSFDSDKLSIARQIVTSNPLNSLQVRDLMHEITFESNKLEFAKYAYHYVIDPHQYYLVSDGFDFSSSVNELDRYIARQ